MYQVGHAMWNSNNQRTGTVDTISKLSSKKLSKNNYFWFDHVMYIHITCPQIIAFFQARRGRYCCSSLHFFRNYNRDRPFEFHFQDHLKVPALKPMLKRKPLILYLVQSTFNLY